MTTMDRQQADYIVPNEWAESRLRLTLLEEIFDPATIRRLEVTGVDAGWRCLEVGAGGGSITRWLCDRVGPGGRVVAVDLDTRFVEEIAAEHPNLEVHRQDIVTESLPDGPFDLVHARALLMHLPARKEVLADLVAAVRPGGWLVIEDGDLFPTLACGTGPYGELQPHLLRTFEPAGVALEWGRTLPAVLAAAGLEVVAADADCQLMRGGSPAAEFNILSYAQVRGALLTGGCPEELIDAAVAALADPGQWFPNMATVGVVGRRPG